MSIYPGKLSHCPFCYGISWEYVNKERKADTIGELLRKRCLECGTIYS